MTGTEIAEFISWSSWGIRIKTGVPGPPSSDDGRMPLLPGMGGRCRLCGEVSGFPAFAVLGGDDLTERIHAGSSGIREPV